MAKKSSNITKKPNNQSIIYSDEYYSMFSYRENPISEAFVADFARQYHDWALDANWRDNDGNEPLAIEQWYASQRMPVATFYNLIDKHKVLADTHKQVKAILSTRRSIGALKRKYDAGTVNSSQYKYDEEYLSEREHIALKTKHKAEEEKKLGPQNFNIIKGCPECSCDKCRAIFLTQDNQ